MEIDLPAVTVGDFNISFSQPDRNQQGYGKTEQ